MEQVSYRTTHRTVRIEVKVSGRLVWAYPAEGRRPVLVEAVELRYDHGDDGYGVSALIRGPYLLRDGKPAKSRADDPAGYVYERWPAWLRALAETHHPERYAEHRGVINVVD